VVSQLRASREFRTRVNAAASEARLLHVHGLWLLPNVDAGNAARYAGIPLVVSPRGMLATEALAISGWRKRIFWTALQKRAYAHAGLWHATADSEAEEIRKFGIKAPIVVVPNGVDVPETGPDLSPREKRGGVILYLGRIHPKKGLIGLVNAWARVAR
jgi:glycosyltransferase involved in cell wall biosynthesis